MVAGGPALPLVEKEIALLDADEEDIFSILDSSQISLRGCILAARPNRGARQARKW